MFDKFGNMMNQMKMMQQLMKDENFRVLMNNPKVREVFMDPEFQRLVRENDISQTMANPKFASLMSDPEIRQLISKLNPQDFKTS